jgi:hypothetical protein
MVRGAVLQLLQCSLAVISGTNSVESERYPRAVIFPAAVRQLL